jgi:hypothetical protein
MVDGMEASDKDLGIPDVAELPDGVDFEEELLRDLQESLEADADENDCPGLCECWINEDGDYNQCCLPCTRPRGHGSDDADGLTFFHACELHQGGQQPEAEDAGSPVSPDEADAKTERAGDDQEAGNKKAMILRFALPVASRSPKFVAMAVQLTILKLQNNGFKVERFHADRALEFTANALKSWLLDHGVVFLLHYSR